MVLTPDIELIKGGILKNKRKATLYGLVFILLFFAVIFTYNNYFMYSKTIARVTNVENSFAYEETSEEGIIEKYYNQEITAVIKNGEYNGKSIKLTNKYSYSGVYDEEYKKGNALFITVNENNEGLTGSILKVKRDQYVVLTLAIFLIAITLVSGKKGLMAVLSLIINIALFMYALELYSKGENILFLCNILIIFFSIFSLVLVSGINKQTLIAIISTLVSMGVISFVYKLAAHFGEQPEYMMMEYISKVDDLELIFMAGVLIGCLGAIMDVAISISVAVNELINKDRNITVKALTISVKEIGYDIMGTMINVLFFNYMCGTIPMIILKIKNGYPLISILKFQIPFEIIRFLVGGIGIVLAIPISGFIAILIMKGRKLIND